MEDVWDALDGLIEAAVSEAERAGVYMPAIATRLRLLAGEYAERYPDDSNGGLAAE